MFEDAHAHGENRRGVAEQDLRYRARVRYVNIEADSVDWSTNRRLDAQVRSGFHYGRYGTDGNDL